jgi:PDZ domain-containing protein
VVKRLLAVGVVVALLAGVLFLVPSDHYLFLPDPARPVDPLVRVPGEERGEDDQGGIYMVDIFVRRASLFERIFPGVEDGATLHRREEVNPTGVSERMRRQESLNEMSRSQEIAVTVALRSLGRHVRVERLGAEVALVLPDRPAEGELAIGDVVVEARGRAVDGPEALLRAMEPLRPGDTVELVVLRDRKQRTVRLRTTAAEDDEARAVVGIRVEQAAEFDFPIDIEIDAGDVGGPSAGLAFALDVVDELGRDLDDGRRIAVTGALELDGDVLAIGGIRQKTFGAREAGAQVFVVPDENAAEARRYAEGLRIVAVSDFRDALAALQTR